MLDRFNALVVAAYLYVGSFTQTAKEKVKAFMDDERGLSGVVVAVLLILVAVLAVVLLWGLLGDWINSLWTRIMGQADSGLQPADH